MKCNYILLFRRNAASALNKGGPFNHSAYIFETHVVTTIGNGAVIRQPQYRKFSFEKFAHQNNNFLRITFCFFICKYRILLPLYSLSLFSRNSTNQSWPVSSNNIAIIMEVNSLGRYTYLLLIYLSETKRCN